MPGPVFLEGEQVSLRGVEPSDYEFIARHLSDPSMRRQFGDQRRPLTAAEVETRIEDDDATHFLACRDGSPVGSAFLLEIDLAGRNAELGYWIAPGDQGNGYATEAVSLCLTHAFDELGLHKVWARTAADNEGSKRVLEKLGFEREGVLREHWYGFGDYVDEHRYGLLRPEFSAGAATADR